MLEEALVFPNFLLFDIAFTEPGHFRILDSLVYDWVDERVHGLHKRFGLVLEQLKQRPDPPNTLASRNDKLGV